MEKHIIFLYPLHPVIQELKDELEKEGGYDIYEIDDAKEYRQLVGVIGQSVTLTSDVRKIHSTIDVQSHLIKNGTSKVIIMGKIQNHPQEVSQLRVLGVQELLPESAPLKSVQFKLHLFLKGFEAQEIQKQKDLEKEAKKNKKLEVKKHQPLVVGKPLEDNMRLESKEPLQKQKIHFDFKGFVRNEKKPFSVKSIEELKEKKFIRPIFTEEQLQQKINNRKKQGIIFDEIAPNLNENDGSETEDSKSYNKKSYKSERLTSDVEKKTHSSPFRVTGDENPAPVKELSEKEKKEEKLLARKKELEEAAQLIKRSRESLRLGQEEEKKISTPLRVGTEEEKIQTNQEDDAEELKRKKYSAFRVDEDGCSKEKHKDLRLENLKENIIRENGDDKTKSSKENGLSLESAKDWGEQTIDYTDFDKDNRDGMSSQSGSASHGPHPQEESAEDLFLRYPDFYYPPTGISTFIPLLLEVLQTRPFDQNKFIQFLCFMFHKKMDATLTYILEQDDQVKILGSTFLIGNKEWDFHEVYRKSKLDELKSIIVPKWSDETFQDSVITFVFPFYFNKQRMGLAHAIFDKGTVRNHQEALEVELLVVMARTVFLKEFGY